MSATHERLFTQMELDAMCVPAHERLSAAIRSADKDAIRGVYRELVVQANQFSTAIFDWTVWTYEYIRDKFGHDELVLQFRPERIIELALRGGMSLDDVVLAQALLEGRDNALTDRVMRAIDEGDDDGIMAGWLETERILQDSGDLRRDLVSDLLGEIYASHGYEALYAAQIYACEHGWWIHNLPRQALMDPRDRLVGMVTFLATGNGSTVSVEELDDRWIVRMSKCGTCGRQVRDRYADDSWGLRLLEEDVPATSGKGPMTMYQSHLAITHHIFAIDLVGTPLPAMRCAGVEAGRRPCEIHVFKELSDTDDRDYSVVGRSKAVPRGHWTDT
jgi:hypothetical protein